MVFFLSHRRFVCSPGVDFYFLSHSFISHSGMMLIFKCSIMKKSSTTESIIQNRIKTEFPNEMAASISVTQTKQMCAAVACLRYMSQIMAADCFDSIFLLWIFQVSTEMKCSHHHRHHRLPSSPRFFSSILCAFCVKV